MPRLTRKIGHLTGTTSQMGSTASRRNTFSARVSHYENNDSINQIGKEKYRMVKHPLRTKMSTMSGANNSKSLLGNSMGPNANADPEQVLKDLKLIQKAKYDERQSQYSGIPNSSLPNINKK